MSSSAREAEPSRGVRSVALLSAPLAPLALIGGWTLAAARQPDGFDPVSETISALAAEGAPERWIMTTGFVIVGLCHLVTAWSLRGGHPAGRAILALGGVAVLLVAVLPEPMPAHVPVAALSFLALAVWPAFAGIPARGIAVGATVVLVALLVWFGLELDGPRIGLAERVAAGAQVLWPLATVLLLRRRTPDSPQER